MITSGATVVQQSISSLVIGQDDMGDVDALGEAADDPAKVELKNDMRSLLMLLRRDGL